MSTYTAPLNDIRFALHDVIKAEPLFALSLNRTQMASYRPTMVPEVWMKEQGVLTTEDGEGRLLLEGAQPRPAERVDDVMLQHRMKPVETPIRVAATTLTRCLPIRRHSSRGPHGTRRCVDRALRGQLDV